MKYSNVYQHQVILNALSRFRETKYEWHFHDILILSKKTMSSQISLTRIQQEFLSAYYYDNVRGFPSQHIIG